MQRDQISVLIADDERLISEIVSLILEGAGFKVLGTAPSATQIVRLAKETQPDVIILDVKLFGQAGLSVLPQLRRTCATASILILSAWSRPEYLARAMIHGAAGYLTKDVSARYLIATIEEAATRKPQYPKRILEAAIDLLSGNISNNWQSSDPETLDSEFTIQESRILTLVAEGMNNDEIADLLDLSSATVKTHMNRILRKLRLPDRTSAAVWAYTQGGLLEVR